MALGQRRMVYTNLWQNESFAKMTKLARLVYIGLITLADDDGRLKGNTTLLKSQIFPYEPRISVDDIKKAVKEAVNAKLIIFYKEGNNYYIAHPNWTKYQLLRADRKRDSAIPPPNDNQMTTKSPHKLSKDKIREENSASYLKRIPEKDLEEFYNRFDASKKAIISKGEDLFLWCEANGRVKKNYKATLLNALKKDFPERKEKPKSQRVEMIDGKPTIIN